MRKIDSLYGSHAPVNFTLKAAFSSISEMVRNFKNGADYVQVYFGDFCIIDTPNKQDKDNGKIFERGYDYQNDMGGAIYRGSLVGPSGPSPWFAMESIDNVKAVSKEDISGTPYTYRRFPIGKDSNGRYITAENGDIATFDFGKPEVLVPGKDENGKFNDAIKYTWCNVRADDADADSWFYVGWQIPYLTVDYGIHSNSPYGSNGARLTDASTIKRTDDKTHPFYEQWDIGLPHGIKGDAIRNLRVITPTTGQKIYPWTALKINSSTGVATIDTNAANYDGFQDDVNKKHQIIVFEYYAFDNNINPSPYLIYLGDFNTVKNVSVAEDGTLTISYTSKDNDVQSKLVKWVKNVTLTTTEGANGGLFTVTYNNDAPQFQTQLQWIKDIEIASDGTVTYRYVGKNTVVDDKKLLWLDDVTLDTDNGRMDVTFNNDRKQHTYYLQWVKDISIAENGTITLHYTGNKPDVNLATKLTKIVSAQASADGILTFTLNTGDTIRLNQTGTDGVFRLKRVDNVILNTGIAEDKHIQVKYNTETQTQKIGDPINFVQDMVVRPSDWHLFVLFNDPQHRYPNVSSNKLDWVAGSELASLNTDPQNPVISNSEELRADVYWRDYGTIKDQAGILIGFNLDYETVKAEGKSSALDWLNSNLPNGLTGLQNELGGISTMGKVVAYTPQKTEKNPNPGCEFYAFDYQLSTRGGYHWFYLGTIADDGMRDVGFLTPGASVDTVAVKVNTKGLIFKQATFTIGDSMKKFWAING